MAGVTPLHARPSTYFENNGTRRTVPIEPAERAHPQLRPFASRMSTMFSRGSIYDEAEMRWNGSPEDNAGIFSSLLFLWVQPLFSRAAWLHARGRPLQNRDLIPLTDQDGAGNVDENFAAQWRIHVAEATSSGERIDDKTIRESVLKKSLLGMLGWRFKFAGAIKFVNSSLQFAFPLLINSILEFVQETQSGEITSDDSAEQRNRGYWLSALLFAAMAAKAICENAYFHLVYRSAYQARISVTTAVYGKALRLTAAARQRKTLGELVNLMQVDATKIEAFVPQIHVLWDGLLQIIGYMAVLFSLIGWPCIIGLLLMILAAPSQKSIMKKLFGLNRLMVRHTDARVKTTNEALQSALCLKMYAWEDNFADRISQSRDAELAFLKKSAYLRGFSRAYMGALPALVAVVSFVTYAVTTDDRISAAKLFAALIAFDNLRFPLLFYPMALAQLAQAKVSVQRLADFLVMHEIATESQQSQPNQQTEGRSESSKHHSHVDRDGVASGQGGGYVSIDNVTAFWSDPSHATSEPDEDNSQPQKKKGPSDDEKPQAPSAKDDADQADKNSSGRPTLADVSLNVDPGQLCAVVGPVGCGKSSLCSAMLNEMVLTSGSVKVRGSVSYAAQSPWILNATLRDNILFGRPYEKERYEAVVKASQLEHDLELLDNGDMTEIGERGINLSGGQKQRVSVARAAYANCDVIILDDPLSALDPEVGARLFEECIIKLMAGKTRVLVTNQLQCLKHCDTCCVIGEGKLVEQGTFEELSKVEGGEVKRLLDGVAESLAGNSNHDGDEASEASEGASGESKLTDATNRASRSRTVSSSGGKSLAEEAKEKSLVTKEERNLGAVKLYVYGRWIKSGGGYVLFSGVFMSFVMCSFVGLLVNLWVTLWTSDPTYKKQSRGFYLGMYAATAFLNGGVTFLRSFLLARFGVRSSNQLHRGLLTSILSAPMSFFDTTPTGRILSRFSKDMHAIDEELTQFFDFFIFCSLFVLLSLGTITFVTPLFGIAVVPILFVYVRILNYFREVSLETKRLDSVTRSPVFAHFSETLGGLSTIRAYAQSGRFLADFQKKLDLNTRAYASIKAADRWLSVRLELIGALIGGLAAFFCSHVVIEGGETGHETNDAFASYAGLALTYAISVTGLLNWTVRSFAQLEAAMNSCERVLYYTDKIPREAARDEASLQLDAMQGGPVDRVASPATYAVVSAGGKSAVVDPSWPKEGRIQFSKLRMRYRVGTPVVLRGIDVEIAGGERIGVVGRTGSGKSSLLLCMMRLVEPLLLSDEDIKNDNKDGSDNDPYLAPIVIDGVDILRVGLRTLRSRIGIIPQNPVLFSGTVRTNLDPFGEHDDETIWQALEKCSMKEAVEAMTDKLASPVAEYGDNLSQGQRQLLCLGRALLKDCKILLLDEATSSVDFETDQAIQATIRDSFPNSTVLTIAHRINTIMDADRVLVLSNGRVSEFAPPGELLADDTSAFSQIVQHAQAEAE